MRRADPLRNVVFATWIEKVDSRCIAGIARGSETWKGVIFAASTFVLVEVDPVRPWVSASSAKSRALGKLTGELSRGEHCKDGRFFNRHGMPMIGYLRDLRR